MLRCIVEKIGAKAILEWDSSLPSELYKVLEEYSLVSHVSCFFLLKFQLCTHTSNDTILLI